VELIAFVAEFGEERDHLAPQLVLLLDFILVLDVL
jgi:hypothetical protein